MKFEAEVCEWNPVQGRGAFGGCDPGACERQAEVSIQRRRAGKLESWHLCEKCADSAEFTAARRKPIYTFGRARI